MRKILFLLPLFLFFHLHGADECGQTPASKRFVLRHLEGSGIGYDHGYTSIDLFFASAKGWDKNWVPFLDLRGHLFNNSKFATNLGMGARYVAPSRVWGGNIYYDYRNSGRKHYNQVAGGLESLGRIWDFRLNGYYPLGSKHSGLYNKGFDHFEGNCAVLSSRREFALKGFNAEVGAHIDHFKKAPLYFAGGTYYLNGEGRSSWGGEFRAVLTLLDHIRLEGETSYDSLYKWTGRGQISAIIPFGKRAKVKKRNSSCGRAMALARRAYQRVDRHEIIPVDDLKKTSKALNPTTCNPYHFIFVNNQCNSDGTAESPYPLLTTALANSAPGDILYVFPGDGTPYQANAAAGFQLLDRQRLLGSAVSHTLSTQFGLIQIPAQSATYPNVTNTALDSTVISLANHNEVAGMHVVGDSVAIGINAVDASPSVTGYIRKNWVEISNSSVATGMFVEYTNANGIAKYVISDNRLNRIMAFGDDATGIEAQNSGPSSLFKITGNRITNIVSSAGESDGIFAVIVGGATSSRFVIANNQISGIESVSRSKGIEVQNFALSSTFSITDNRILDLDSGVSSVGVVVDNNIGLSTFSISRNLIANINSTTGTNFGIQATNGGDASSFTFIGNSISDITSQVSIFGILAENFNPSTTFTFRANQISDLTAATNAYGINAQNSGASTLFSLYNNQTSNISGGGISSGITVAAANDLCLILIDNFAPPSIDLVWTAGTFNVNPSSRDNNPKPTSTGTVTYSACTL